jgi:radial spoke head protein 4A
VLLKVLAERPNSGVEAFEQLSTIVKQERLLPDNAAQDPLKEEAALAAHKYAQAVEALHIGPPTSEDPDDEPEGLAPSRPDVVEDVLAKCVMWDAAGVNPVGTREDAIRLMMAMGQLAGSDDAITSLRFWGKLQGKAGDYFIVEGNRGGPTDEVEEGAEAPEPEANLLTYWTCPFPGSTEWTELPSVTPSAVLAAQKIRRFLTGNLHDAVCGFPVFPGTERHLVRAIIAQINSDCAIHPSGYYIVEDEATEATLNEEYEAGDVTDVAGWKNHGLALNSLGKVQAVETEDEEGNAVSEPEGWTLEPLREEVTADAWTLRTFPRVLSGCAAETAILRGTKWPGAYAMANMASGKWTNVYVGFGVQYLDEAYTPPMPPPLQQEFDTSELMEQEDVLEDPSPPEEEDDE